MKPSNGTYWLLRWTRWLASAVNWQQILMGWDKGRIGYGAHAASVARYAREDLNQWRAITFP